MTIIIVIWVEIKKTTKNDCKYMSYNPCKNHRVFNENRSLYALGYKRACTKELSRALSISVTADHRHLEMLPRISMLMQLSDVVDASVVVIKFPLI